jgi:pseudouridine-5'-phosphate glycosidase
MSSGRVQVSEEVTAAVAAGRPVVALESTLICHGLPWPANLETAREAEAAVRAGGAVPATVAVLAGVPTVGLSAAEVEELARTPGVFKAGRRDLGPAVALKRTAATTVSATMALAHRTGVRVFGTGGIGGAHRGGPPFDLSADLVELARTPVLVVCAGAKSVLDLPQTAELLETLGVPVLTYQSDEVPAFYTAGGGGPGSCRVDTPGQAAAAFAAHVALGGGGAVLANPPAETVPADEFAAALAVAESEAKGLSGPAVSPFLLKRLAELTGGKTLAANRALIVGNARLAALCGASL